MWVVEYVRKNYEHAKGFIYIATIKFKCARTEVYEKSVNQVWL